MLSRLPNTLARVSLIVILISLSLGLAQNELEESLFGSGEETSEESLFGSDDDIFGDSLVTEITDDQETNPADTLLTSDKVVIGGRFNVSTELTLDLSEDQDERLSSGLSDLSTRLFLDARPDPNLGILVKTDINYQTTTGVSLNLREAFLDTDLFDRVFLRVGKQTINWGVGLFFSPANLINLEAIDPEDTDAELLGPVAVKAQYPIGNNNLSSYLILDDISSGQDIGIASRYEFLISGYEFTVGGIYQPERPWALMTTSTGSIEDVTIFAEVVVEGNSDKVFIVEDDTLATGFDTRRRPDELFVSGTLGGRYSYSSDDDLWSIFASGQYFFNGKGYSGEQLDFFEDVLTQLGNFQSSQNFSFTDEIRPQDFFERGLHYTALSLSSPDIINSELTPSLFWLANISDGSGLINASLSYAGLENISPSLSYRTTYGPEFSEYSPTGNRSSLSLSLSIRGSF